MSTSIADTNTHLKVYTKKEAKTKLYLLRFGSFGSLCSIPLCIYYSDFLKEYFSGGECFFIFVILPFVAFITLGTFSIGYFHLNAGELQKLEETEGQQVVAVLKKLAARQGFLLEKQVSEVKKQREAENSKKIYSRWGIN